MNSLSIASKPQSIAQVEDYVDSLKSTYNIDDEMYGNILICITEAVNNAIYHGNKEEEDKKVNILTSIDSNKITISVSDEGEGFNYNNLPDPTDPANLIHASGRGLFLIKQLSDLLIFNNEGSSLEMTFKI